MIGRDRPLTWGGLVVFAVDTVLWAAVLAALGRGMGWW